MARAEIDASASELDLRMTEGDPVGFNWLTKGAALWGGHGYKCQVKATQEAEAASIVDLVCVVTTEGPDADVNIFHDPVPELVAIDGYYYWDMQEIGGATRFGGRFIVMPQVTT